MALLSLEMAPGSIVTQRYRDEYIARENLGSIEITGQPPTYAELCALCRRYDVVAIDSWTKLRGVTQMVDGMCNVGAEYLGYSVVQKAYRAMLALIGVRRKHSFYIFLKRV